MYNRDGYEMIRSDTLDSLIRYAKDRIPTGGFLHAVLRNDLRDACARADSGNLATLADIVRFCYWEIPADCWGSPDHVDEWLRHRDVVGAGTGDTKIASDVADLTGDGK